MLAELRQQEAARDGSWSAAGTGAEEWSGSNKASGRRRDVPALCGSDQFARPTDLLPPEHLTRTGALDDQPIMLWPAMLPEVEDVVLVYGAEIEVAAGHLQLIAERRALHHHLRRKGR